MSRTHVGKYRLLRLVGEGAMGQIFEAEDELLGRRVAIKLIRPDLQTNPEALERFFREARAAARLETQGAVRIFEFGNAADGTPFIAMEFLSGQSLRALVQQGPLPEARALGIVKRVAAVLREAHERQIVHRDLKPDNILLVPDPTTPDEEQVKVVDFGIARLLTDPNQTHGAAGTPTYMAPEQCRSGEITGRTDVYALGILLYEMLAGQPPFTGGWAGVLVGHMNQAPPPLPKEVSEVVAALVGRMLAKDPAGRPDMDGVLRSLRAAEVALAGRPSAVPLAPLPRASSAPWSEQQRPAAPLRPGPTPAGPLRPGPTPVATGGPPVGGAGGWTGEAPVGAAGGWTAEAPVGAAGGWTGGPPTATRRPGWGPLIVGLLAVFGAGLGTAYVLRPQSPPAPPAPVPSPAPAPAPTPAPPPAPAPARWRISTEPSAAVVTRSGTNQTLCTTPCDLPAGPTTTKITISRPNFLSTDVTLQKDQPEDVHRELLPE